MLFANAALDLFWLVISVVFAVVALYIAFALLGKITPDINEEKELAGGNVAVGIVVASVFVAVAIVVESGVTGLSVGLNKALDVGFFTGDGLLFVGSAFAQLILGIALAVIAIYLAISIFERLTHGVGECEDLRKGNVAVALEMAGIIIAVAVIIQSGVLGITAALV